MKPILIFIIFLLPFVANADSSTVIVAFDRVDISNNSFIDVNADYAAVSMTLSSDAKYPAERIKLLKQLLTTIESAAKKDNSIVLQKENVSVSPRKESSLSFSKMYSASNRTTVYLLSPLSANSDIYQATIKIYAFISSIEKPDDTEISLSDISLAINDSSKYRDDLLKKLKAEIDSTKEIIGTNYKVSIAGLDNAVLVKQLNDKQVRLSINYSLKFTE